MQGGTLPFANTSRRRLLSAAAVGGIGLLTRKAFGETIDFGVKGGSSTRPTITTFPEKGRMVLQRTRPPWLETPFDVFDKGVLTPNDQHFVSWHWATFPTSVDLATYELKVRGLVERPQSFSLKDLIHGLPRFELTAVAQCAGNSRLYAQPRVAGAQWANGSMSNARWGGVRLKDVLDRVGVKAGARCVRFGGLDEPILPDAPKFLKSIDIDHARDGEVMLAFAMNGEQLPMLNGFPLKLIVPGWCAVYWIKMLNDIEVMGEADTNYWTTTAYRVPNKPHYTVTPATTDLDLIAITKMVPRSFVTNIVSGATLAAEKPNLVRGIAFGGDRGVAAVDLSLDGGRTWRPTDLGKDEGTYSFRQWQTNVVLPSKGAHALMVRCTNTDKVAQPMQPVWNPGGYMINTIETTHVVAA